MKDVVIKGWVAKDEYGDCNFFSVKPQRMVLPNGSKSWWLPGAAYTLALGFRKEYDDLRWEDEPLEATVTITIDGQETGE